MRTIRNNAKTCRQIGGMSIDLHCYINNDSIEELDIRCENIGGLIREIPVTARVSNFICEIPLDSLSKIPENKINALIKKSQDADFAVYYSSETRKPTQWQNIKKLDAQIRTINAPNDDFEEWVVNIGVYESLGEQGGDVLTMFYKKEPTFEEIEADIKNHLLEQEKELSTSGALSGREEMQLKALKRILKEIKK